MKLSRILSLALVLGMVGLAFARPAAKPAESPVQSTAPKEVNQQWLIEGEKRYRANCGRCHQAPHNFSPRVMAMAVRHMRVRAMLTDDDMKYVLYYMTH